MILDSMTLEESRDEILKDLPFVHNALTKRLMPQLRRYIVKQKKRTRKRQHIVRQYLIKSPRKNNWIITLENDLKVKDSFLYGIGVYRYGERGLTLYHLMTDNYTMNVYIGHFFTRFNERMGLKINDSIDRLKRFFLKNMVVWAKEEAVQVDAEVFKATGVVREGIALGDYDRHSSIRYWRTFISKEQYREKQQQTVYEASEELMRMSKDNVEKFDKVALSDLERISRSLSQA